MPSTKKKLTPKNRAKAISVKKCTGSTGGNTKKVISTPLKTRPTQSELKTAAKKVIKQYSIAIKNLARR